MEQVDERILGFFRSVIKTKYHGKIADIEIDSLANQAYNQFAAYLVTEFKAKVGFGTEEIQKLKQLQTDKAAMVNYLALLSQNSSETDLDKLLVEILNSFVQSFFD